MNSRLAGTTMCKISFEGGLALKRACLVLTFRTVYSARLQENAGLLVVVEPCTVLTIESYFISLLFGKKSKAFC